jgi:pimeloyl-ACP methyl ester carboxylesterase
LKLEGGLNLVGLSYGGWIFTHYALRHPERVAKLVQLAPAGTVARIPWGFIWRGILCIIPLRFFMQMFMDWIRVTDATDEAAKKKLDDMADDAYIAQHSFKSRRMVAPVPLSDAQWKRLNVPTLLLAGDREVIFPAKESLVRVGALAPNMRTELLAGTGHDFFAARADEVNRRVLQFLDEKPN